MKINYRDVIATSILFFLASCAGKEQIRQAINEDPSIVFDAIEKYPNQFLEVATKASQKVRALAQIKAQETENKRREDEYKNPKTPSITSDRAVSGVDTAQFTLVVYSDFQCPYCQRGYNTVQELKKKYGDKMRFVFKHLPLDFHAMALPAAKYFEAIALQDSAKAYAFHDEVFKNQKELTSGKERFLDRMAKKVGANLVKLKQELNSEIVLAHIKADTEEAKKFGISGTPGFVVAGITLAGAYPAEAFIEVIEKQQAENANAKRTVSSIEK